MRQLAIYGKGGIGKSMVSSHISFAFASAGLRVLHLGCDPKHDSTRLLLGGRIPHAILDILRKVDFETREVALEDVVLESDLNDTVPGQLYCAESGGPQTSRAQRPLAAGLMARHGASPPRPYSSATGTV